MKYKVKKKDYLDILNSKKSEIEHYIQNWLFQVQYNTPLYEDQSKAVFSKLKELKKLKKKYKKILKEINKVEKNEN